MSITGLTIRTRRFRKGFATVIVLVCIAITTLVLSRIQTSAYRVASSGREAVAVTRARWAARAGLESAIARLAHNNRGVERTNAYGVYNDLDGVASGTLRFARFDVVHADASGDDAIGPGDAHAKININRMGFDDLLELEGMSEDMAAAIIDWIDEDDVVSEFGAESGYYRSLFPPYEAANDLIGSLRELELIVGISPELVRGEDWNLNGRLDPNENDGDATFPPDNRNGLLEAGWSAIITADSTDEGLAASGQPRVNLLSTDQRTLIQRVAPLEAIQATVILEWAAGGDVRVEDLIANDLQSIAQGLPTLGVPPENVANLEPDQLRRILDETTIRESTDPPGAGRININTVEREVLDYVTSIPPVLADLIFLTRNSKPNGFLSILELEEVPSLGGRSDLITQLSNVLTVESNAFTVSSVGRDTRSGIEVEIHATIERSALPIVISDLSER